MAGNYYNCYNQQFKIFLHHRKVSEEIPGITEKRYPGSSPYQIVYHEIVIMHLPHSSYKWGKSAHNGNKPCYDYSLATIFFIKFMCLIQMTLLEYSGIGVIKQLAPKEMPYHIVTRISQHSSKKQDKSKDIYFKRCSR